MNEFTKKLCRLGIAVFAASAVAKTPAKRRPPGRDTLSRVSPSWIAGDWMSVVKSETGCTAEGSCHAGERAHFTFLPNGTYLETFVRSGTEPGKGTFSIRRTRSPEGKNELLLTLNGDYFPGNYSLAKFQYRYACGKTVNRIIATFPADPTHKTAGMIAPLNLVDKDDECPPDPKDERIDLSP